MSTIHTTLPLKPREPVAIIKVRGVLLYSGKIFLCKLASPAGFYCLPGGTLDPGESLQTCLKREMFEELGVHANIGKLLYTQQILRENYPITLDFWYHIENPEDFLHVDISKASHGDEHETVGWYALDGDIDAYKPGVLPELLNQWNTEGAVFIQEKTHE